MTDGRDGSLEALIETAAADLGDARRQLGAAGLEWSTRGTVFAAVAGNQAEFRLTLPVVAAALRTPDTTRSPRGADWVAFAPTELDEHAVDRATAWLASAWRRVGADA